MTKSDDICALILDSRKELATRKNKREQGNLQFTGQHNQSPNFDYLSNTLNIIKSEDPW